MKNSYKVLFFLRIFIRYSIISLRNMWHFQGIILILKKWDGIQSDKMINTFQFMLKADKNKSSLQEIKYRVSHNFFRFENILIQIISTGVRLACVDFLRSQMCSGIKKK